MEFKDVFYGPESLSISVFEEQKPPLPIWLFFNKFSPVKQIPNFVFTCISLTIDLILLINVVTLVNTKVFKLCSLVRSVIIADLASNIFYLVYSIGSLYHGNIWTTGWISRELRVLAKSTLPLASLASGLAMLSACVSIQAASFPDVNLWLRRSRQRKKHLSKQSKIVSKQMKQNDGENSFGLASVRAVSKFMYPAKFATKVRQSIHALPLSRTQKLYLSGLDPTKSSKVGS